MKSRVVWLLYEWDDLQSVYESSEGAKAKAKAMAEGQGLPDITWEEGTSSLGNKYAELHGYVGVERFVIYPEWVHK